MHAEAYNEAEKFVKDYLSTQHNIKVLDVGSYDVNGTLKPLFAKDSWEYHGLDIEEGKNVDIVGDLYKFPIKANTYDVIVSTSCFEHVKFFWQTFNEMCRVLKKGGLIYICAPSTGVYHKYPVDCWRFYADSYQALAEWNGGVKLLEQHLIEGEFKDNIGIFVKK